MAIKKICESDDNQGSLESLLGEQVILFCMNYHYFGKLIAVSPTYVVLESGGIVYETGEFNAKAWKDAQQIGQLLSVVVDKIESYCKGK